MQKRNKNNLFGKCTKATKINILSAQSFVDDSRSSSAFETTIYFQTDEYFSEIVENLPRMTI